MRHEVGKTFYSMAFDAPRRRLGAHRIFGMLLVHCTMLCVRSEVCACLAAVCVAHKHGLVSAQGVPHTLRRSLAGTVSATQQSALTDPLNRRALSCEYRADTRCVDKIQANTEVMKLLIEHV